jgi:hypothetical protein
MGVTMKDFDRISIDRMSKMSPAESMDFAESLLSESMKLKPGDDASELESRLDVFEAAMRIRNRELADRRVEEIMRLLSDLHANFG